MENEKKHLPLFGIGPILCFPMAIISAAAIFLSIKGLIPFVIENKVIKYIFIVLGIVLIIEAFVRNPCYAVYLLGSTGALLIAHNPVLLILPILFWLEMTIVLKNTEEKWLGRKMAQRVIWTGIYRLL